MRFSPSFDRRRDTLPAAVSTGSQNDKISLLRLLQVWAARGPASVCRSPEGPAVLRPIINSRRQGLLALTFAGSLTSGRFCRLHSGGGGARRPGEGGVVGRGKGERKFFCFCSKVYVDFPPLFSPLFLGGRGPCRVGYNIFLFCYSIGT